MGFWQRNGELLAAALEDPELADAIYTGEADISPGKERQFLFVRAMYSSIVLAWMTGAIVWEELHGRLRVLMRQPVAREYWEARQLNARACHVTRTKPGRRAWSMRSSRSSRA